MKGIVFTEFFEHIDEIFSMEISEQLIEMSDLPSEAVYTAVGTYDVQEMQTLVTNLSALVGKAVPDILRDFGKHLFCRFLTSFPIFFEGIKSSLEFLPLVNDYVHLEVKKLYPDAELPSFSCETPEPDTLIMTYRSTRNLSYLAEGLILACIEHFGDPLTLQREVVQEKPSVIRFIIGPA